MSRYMALAMIALATPCVVSAQRPAQFGQQQSHRNPPPAARLIPLNSALRRGITTGERGALIGAAIGFAAGALISTSFAGGDNGGARFSHVVLAGLIFAIPGAVLGGIIGHAAGK